MSNVKQLVELRKIFNEIWQVYITLLKVMVPAIIIVKALDMLGATAVLGSMLAPIMQFVGLPEQMGVVWATAILTNVYTAMVVFVNVSDTLALTTAQVSVIGILILISQSIPIEVAVAKMVGVSWRITIVLKILGGLLLAGAVNSLYLFFDYQQEPAVLLWQGTVSDES